MKVLSINAGSSSLKFKLFDKDSLSPISSGIFKNYEENKYSFEADLNEKIELIEDSYINSVEYLTQYLKDSQKIQDVSEIEYVVHRIVHGGEEFLNAVELTDENIQKINKYSEFAPLHNPFAVEKIMQFKKIFQGLKRFGVFDTSFHLTNIKEDFLYGLPYGYYENLRVRKYGFHGISHKYVSEQVSKINNSNNLKIISCHLGSGSSVCAIENGKSIDHSFGFTPNENLVMATRSGEVDYDAVTFLKKKLGLDETGVEKLLNNESGLLGISGYTKDMKTLIADYKTNDRARLAVDMYVNAIIRYISYLFVKLNGTDYITFTGGVGAGSDVIREMIISKLSILNISINKEINTGKIDVEEVLDISNSSSKTKVVIIPTDEELQMLNEVQIVL